MSESTTLQIKEAQELQVQGRLDDAALIYKKLLDNDPENTAALFGVGNIALERGKLANAALLFEKITKIDPGHAEAFVKAGTIYIQTNKLGWAKYCFEKALEIDDMQLPAYNNFGIYYLKIHDFWAAEEICRAGLERDRKFAPVYTVLGKALHSQGRAEEAIACYKEGLRYCVAEDKADGYCNLGVVYARLSDKKKAVYYFRKALALKPDHVGIHLAFSDVRKYKKDDPHIKQMEALLEKLPKRSVDASDLHSALGKAYDDTGNIDKAFTHFSQANYIARSSFNYTTGSTREYFSGIKKSFGGGFEQMALKPRKKDITPIFIVGMMRSGTTLTEQILASHSEVGAAGETVYLEQVFGGWGFNDLVYEGRNIEELGQDALKDMRDSYLNKLVRYAPGKKYITDKMPTNFRYIGLIRLLFPQAKIIHCRRDPMDSCFSIFKHMFSGFFPFAYDLKELAQYYKYYEDLMKYWHKRLPGFVHDVQYEELVTNQEDVTRALLKFCGLKWDPACLEFHKSGRTVLTASAQQVKKPLYKSGVGSWKRYEKHLGVLRKELGV